MPLSSHFHILIYSVIVLGQALISAAIKLNTIPGLGIIGGSVLLCCCNGF